MPRRGPVRITPQPHRDCPYPLLTSKQARARLGRHSDLSQFKHEGHLVNYGTRKTALWCQSEIDQLPDLIAARRSEVQKRNKRSHTCVAEGCGQPCGPSGRCKPHRLVNRRADTPEKKAVYNAELSLRRSGKIGPPRSLGLNLIARTCGRCGEMITTPDNQLRKSAGKIPPCRRCQVKASVNYWRRRRQIDAEYASRPGRRATQVNDDLRAQATRHGYQWTGPELEIAARLDLTVREKAAMLGRSYYAVRVVMRKIREPQKANVAGLPSDHPLATK